VGGAALRLFLARFQHVVNVASAKGHDVRVLRDKLGALEQRRLDRAITCNAENRLWRSGEQLGAPHR
jgi:hypothetical protein